MKSSRAIALLLTSGLAACTLAGAPAAARARFRPEATPHIARLEVRVVGEVLHLTLVGKGFGWLRPDAFTGDSRFLWLRDLTRGWQAGDLAHGNRATLHVAHWSNGEIAATYDEATNGHNIWTFQVGQRIEVYVRNPQDGQGARWRGQIP